MLDQSSSTLKKWEHCEVKSGWVSTKSSQLFKSSMDKSSNQAKKENWSILCHQITELVSMGGEVQHEKLLCVWADRGEQWQLHCSTGCISWQISKLEIWRKSARGEHWTVTVALTLDSKRSELHLIWGSPLWPSKFWIGKSMGEEDGTTSCGLGSWRPSWLQRFASRQVKTSLKYQGHHISQVLSYSSYLGCE